MGDGIATTLRSAPSIRIAHRPFHRRPYSHRRGLSRTWPTSATEQSPIHAYHLMSARVGAHIVVNNRVEGNAPLTVAPRFNLTDRMSLNYSDCMLMHRRTVTVSLTMWCLFASWLCFSGLELLEQFTLIPETAAEDQEGQDLDETALAQLASGLKSVVLNLDIPCDTPLANKTTEPAVWLSVPSVHQFVRWMVHSPPSLRLHQQLSVYRI